MQISKIRDIAGTDMFDTNAYGLVKAAEELGFTQKFVNRISKTCNCECDY